MSAEVLDVHLLIDEVSEEVCVVLDEGGGEQAQELHDTVRGALVIEHFQQAGHGAILLHQLDHTVKSIKEVSELVLFKAGSQKVIWGLQDMFFEPEDLSVLSQQRFQIGVAQGPVETVPVPLGLADGGEPFAELLDFPLVNLVFRMVPKN